jgi:hypothetical protein
VSAVASHSKPEDEATLETQLAQVRALTQQLTDLSERLSQAADRALRMLNPREDDDAGR